MSLPIEVDAVYETLCCVNGSESDAKFSMEKSESHTIITLQLNERQKLENNVVKVLFGYETRLLEAKLKIKG